MSIKTTFKRIEKKYIISPEQYSIINEKIKDYFHPDAYGETKICNIYFDTPDFILLSRSVSKPVFKEKLRLRTYGVPTENSVSFAEIKRKCKSVVYKRRISMPLNVAMDFLCGKKNPPEESQISHEIEYFLKFYGEIMPQFYISYDRSAFFSNTDENFRITFDKNLTWRNYDLDLTKGSYGKLLLPDGDILMEIKTSDSVPLWMAKLFSELNIKNSSFSKVGRAYYDVLSQRSLDYEILTNNIFT